MPKKKKNHQKKEKEKRVINFLVWGKYVQSASENIKFIVRGWR